MKKVLETLLLTPIFIIIILISIILIIIILPFILIYLGYAKFWDTVNRVPNVKTTLDCFDEFEQNIWGKIEPGIENLIAEYERFLSDFAKLSGADCMPSPKNMDILKKDYSTYSKEWNYVSVAHTVRTRHAGAIITYSFGLHVLENKTIDVLPSDDDFIDIQAVITQPKQCTDIKLRLGEHGLWALTCMLRGDYELTPKDKQLWCYLKEYGVWMVRYKPEGSYGLRKEYTGSEAREYFFDKKQKNK